jgi:hypothetical protein
MLTGRAMRQIKPGNIHTSPDQLSDHRCRAGRRANSAYNFGSSSV